MHRIHVKIRSNTIGTRDGRLWHKWSKSGSNDLAAICVQLSASRFSPETDQELLNLWSDFRFLLPLSKDTAPTARSAPQISVIRTSRMSRMNQPNSRGEGWPNIDRTATHNLQINKRLLPISSDNCFLPLTQLH